MTELIEEATIVHVRTCTIDLFKLIQLIQLEMLQVAKANTMLSDSAADLYKDLQSYVNEI